LPGVTEVVATFRSLSVNYNPLLSTGDELEQTIITLVNEPARSSHGKRLWDIPVCYDVKFAPDIEDVARSVDLAVAEVAGLHAGTQYHVYMIGFVPGYPYMGDLPAKLQLPRRPDPRTRVPPGSLAIATSMTAVYPYESPGGWHLIGTSPVRFFDAASAKGALLEPGDAVKFRPVTPAEFARIRAAVERGDYIPDSTEIAA
jgi:KipI family sensor histidine kinase inhibitor